MDATRNKTADGDQVVNQLEDTDRSSETGMETDAAWQGRHRTQHMTLTTNLYRLTLSSLPSGPPTLTPAPSTHSTDPSILTSTHPQSTSSSSTSTHICSSSTTLPAPTTSTTASTLVTYSLIICEPGKAQVDLPLPVRTQVLESLKKAYSEVFQDNMVCLGPGNTAYSLGDIPAARNTKFLVNEVENNGSGRNFVVELRKESEVPVEEVMEVVQCPTTASTTSSAATLIKTLETILLYNLSLHMERRQQLFFPHSPLCPNIPLTLSREVQMGYRASLTPASSLLLCVDVCQPVVTKERPLLAFLRTDLSHREAELRLPLSVNARYEHTLLLHDLKVRVTHSKVRRVYRVLEVAAKGADLLLMYIYDQRTATTTRWTVEQYFLHFYGVTLRYPCLNCLQVAPKHRLIFLPMEVCMLVGGQNVSGRGGGWALGKDKQWDLGPEERQQYLSSLVRSPPLTLDPCLTRLGLIVNQQAVTVSGRVLPPPQLLASSPVVPEGGRWQLGTGLTMYRPATLHTWSLVQYDVDGLKKNTLHKKFLERLIEVGKTLGMEMKNPSVDIVRKVTKPMDDLISLETYYPYLQLTVFLMRPGVPYLHEDTKHAGNTILERITQCVEPDTYRNKVDDDQVLRSLLLQMNAKCGGVSVAIDWPAMMPLSSLMCRPALVVGATVDGHLHDFPRSAFLAAMVGMMANEGGPCVTLVHPQHRHHYIINTASNIVFKRLLLRYYEMNHNKPDSLLLYRLEIPEGQVEQVVTWETEEIRKACRSMQSTGDYHPSLTYVCVSRNHHTRLFRGPDEGSGNVPPGTVTDVDITNPSTKCFFLCSHLSDKGTSRPTHYRVMCDGNNLTMEALQTITYGLCHLHACCTQAVSLPMPAAYARQAAQYAREVASRQEGHVAKLESFYDPVPLVTEATIMDHYNKLHTTLYYL